MNRKILLRNILFLMIFVFICIPVFSEDSVLAGLIKDRQTLDSETKADMESYVQGFSINAARNDEGTLIIEGSYTGKGWDTSGDYGGKQGSILVLKSGNEAPGGVFNQTISELKEEIEGGWNIYSDIVFIYTEKLNAAGPFTYNYDIALVCNFWNASGFMTTHLIRYDTLTVSGDGDEFTISGRGYDFSEEETAKTEDKDPGTEKDEKTASNTPEDENKDGLLPSFMYNKIEKAVAYYNIFRKTSDKAKKIYKQILNNVIAKVANGAEVVAAIEEEYKNFWDQLDEEDIDYDRLIQTNWRTKTIIDTKIKDAAYSVVDTCLAGGTLDAVDTLVTAVFSGNKRKVGYIKGTMYDKDELEYKEVKDLESDLDIDETQASSYLHVAKPKNEGSLTKAVNSLKLVKVAKKGINTIVSGVSSLFGVCKKKREISDRELAGWAGSAYRFVGVNVARKMMNGASREQAIEEVRQQFLNTETLADGEYIKKSKFTSAGECFNGLVGLMEKNGVFRRVKK